jgi:hypothetical protein
MQMVITFMTVLAGLIFSVGIALLAEELIFGQVFRLFFSRRHARRPVGQADRESVRQFVSSAVTQSEALKIGQRR